MAKKTTRLKTEEPAIKDWLDANAAVSKIARQQYRIKELEAQAGYDINEIKANLQNQIDPLISDNKVMTKALERFAKANKNDFGNARSKEIACGVLGWRKSTSIVINKTNTLELIKCIKKFVNKKLLIVKETVDRNALAKLTDEELAEINARRQEKDVFFVEPSTVHAADLHPSV